MTDDLVKRLRKETNGELGRLDASSRWGMMIVEAADRIEELEAALRLIADTDPAGDQHWPGRIARTALEGKK
jgi:hypothetical protein